MGHTSWLVKTSLEAKNRGEAHPRISGQNRNVSFQRLALAGDNASIALIRVVRRLTNPNRLNPGEQEGETKAGGVGGPRGGGGVR